MKMKSKELSALEINRLQGNGSYSVGGVTGLYLKIDGNSKSWVLRATIAGKRRNMGLGAYPSVTLSQARDKAREVREHIRNGIDPIDERQKAIRALELEKAKAVTFSEASYRLIDSKEAEWSTKHYLQWKATLETYAFPIIGALPVSEVERAHVIKILDPIWRTKTETATRVRSRIEQVLDWAIVSGYRDSDNPARWKGYLDKILPKPSKVTKVQHYPAVQYKEAAQAMRAISKREGMGAKALMFLILTATRSGEARGAMWSEFDRDLNEWNLSADRMKADCEHKIPLSKEAIALLKSMPRINGCDYVFPSAALGKISDMTMSNLMRRLKFRDVDGRVAVPHGWRSSFRDWVGDCTDYPSDLAEFALAHTVSSKVEAAYRRSTAFERRRAMMQDWADYCFSLIY